MLESYCEDLKLQLNQQHTSHLEQLSRRKLKAKAWRQKYEAIVAKRNEERVSTREELADKENTAVVNGMTPQQMFQAAQDAQSFVPEHIFVRVLALEKSKGD